MSKRVVVCALSLLPALACVEQQREEEGTATTSMEIEDRTCIAYELCGYECGEEGGGGPGSYCCDERSAACLEHLERFCTGYIRMDGHEGPVSCREWVTPTTCGCWDIDCASLRCACDGTGQGCWQACAELYYLMCQY